jgi:5,10-methylenetetrahydromethanopterin reductase
MSIECWTSVPPLPRVAVRDARRVEDEGWDGVVVPDSQNLCADVFVELALCAAATQRLRLGPAVTNPVTRHPAVAASAIASLQAESGGRAVMGIGRGDSALAYIGCAPAPLAHFAAYLRALNSYLAGEAVDFEPAFVAPGIPSVAALGLGTPPPGSALRWLRSDQPRVPVEVAVTGPKMIELAACSADAIALCVGADPSRVAWGIEIARRARERAGLDPETLGIGAYLNVAVHPDVAVAQRLVGGGLASFSRFSVMHGTVAAGARPKDEEVLLGLHRSYDMTAHGRSSAGHVAQLPLEFADANGILGPVDRCLDRLARLRDIGVRKFVIMGLLSAERHAELHRELVATEVLPEIRRW